MSSMKIAAAALIALALATPAAHAQWDYDYDEDDNADWAWVDDLTGIAQLEVYCDNHDWWLTIYTGEDYDAGASYSDQVPLTVSVANAAAYKFIGAFNVLGDELVLDVSIFDDERVMDLAYDLRDATGTIAVSFATYSFTFPTGGAASAVGEFLAYCGR